MKKTFTIQYVFAILIALCVTSCRPESDDLLSYGQNDYQSYYDANHTFAGEFEAFWMAMNENYGIWDYEAEFGLDWDEVYNTYLSRFEELDQRRTRVTDAELEALYTEITDPLHDGHMALTVKNLHTGKYIGLTPHQNRVRREREQDLTEAMLNLTSLDAYLTPEMDAAYRIKAYDGTGSTDIAFEFIDSTMTRAKRAADAYIAMVDAAGGPNASNDSLYVAADSLRVDAQKLILFINTLPLSVRVMMKSYLLATYDMLYTKYAFVGKQIGAPIVELEKEFKEDLLGSFRFALFEGNIAYLRFSGFGLTPHMTSSASSTENPTMYSAYQEAVKRVWHHWFDTIQVLHKSGQLGGVVFDMRNNTGGNLNDYQYVLGALLPSGGWDSHMLRLKNGSGRLDFAPLQPFTAPTYPEAHEVINDRPIVVLANCQSISMAEMTTWGVKSQPNGHFIGVRTYGALSGLSAEPESYSDNYSGAFGVQNVTPIWGYVPKLISLFGEQQQILEGVGITPDQEVHLDANMWMMQQRDNQLEAALDYIRRN